MQMTEAQHVQVKQLVEAVKYELSAGYGYTMLPDSEFIQEATAEDVIDNLRAALASLRQQPGRQ